VHIDKRQNGPEPGASADKNTLAAESFPPRPKAPARKSAKAAKQALQLRAAAVAASHHLVGPTADIQSPDTLSEAVAKAISAQNKDYKPTALSEPMREEFETLKRFLIDRVKALGLDISKVAELVEVFLAPKILQRNSLGLGDCITRSAMLGLEEDRPLTTIERGTVVHEVAHACGFCRAVPVSTNLQTKSVRFVVHGCVRERRDRALFIALEEMAATGHELAYHTAQGLSETKEIKALSFDIALATSEDLNACKIAIQFLHPEAYPAFAKLAGSSGWKEVIEEFGFSTISLDIQETSLGESREEQDVNLPVMVAAFDRIAAEMYPELGTQEGVWKLRDELGLAQLNGQIRPFLERFTAVYGGKAGWILAALNPHHMRTNPARLSCREDVLLQLFARAGEHPPARALEIREAIAELIISSSSKKTAPAFEEQRSKKRPYSLDLMVDPADLETQRRLMAFACERLKASPVLDRQLRNRIAAYRKHYAPGLSDDDSAIQELTLQRRIIEQWSVVKLPQMHKAYLNELGNRLGVPQDAVMQLLATGDRSRIDFNRCETLPGLAARAFFEAMLDQPPADLSVPLEWSLNRLRQFIADAKDSGCYPITVETQIGQAGKHLENQPPELIRGIDEFNMLSVRLMLGLLEGSRLVRSFGEMMAAPFSAGGSKEPRREPKALMEESKEPLLCREPDATTADYVSRVLAAYSLSAGPDALGRITEVLQTAVSNVFSKLPPLENDSIFESVVAALFCKKAAIKDLSFILAADERAYIALMSEVLEAQPPKTALEVAEMASNFCSTQGGLDVCFEDIWKGLLLASAAGTLLNSPAENRPAWLSLPSRQAFQEYVVDHLLRTQTGLLSAADLSQLGVDRPARAGKILEKCSQAQLLGLLSTKEAALTFARTLGRM
jgi:hypothetical protein